MSRRRITDIQVNDKFKFNGLTGQTTLSQTVYTVLSIDYSGTIYLHSDFNGIAGSHKVNYLTFIKMCEEKIYELIESDDDSPVDKGVKDRSKSYREFFMGHGDYETA